MLPDADLLYTALQARDPRFAAFGFVCVKTTGIFCRLTCPARTAKRENCSFRPTVADCLGAGFRPCKRCKPMEDQAFVPLAGSSSVTAS